MVSMALPRLHIVPVLLKLTFDRNVRDKRISWHAQKICGIEPSCSFAKELLVCNLKLIFDRDVREKRITSEMQSIR